MEKVLPSAQVLLHCSYKDMCFSVFSDCKMYFAEQIIFPILTNVENRHYTVNDLRL